MVDFHQDEEGHWVADLACGTRNMCGTIRRGKAGPGWYRSRSSIENRKRAGVQEMRREKDRSATRLL